MDTREAEAYKWLPTIGEWYQVSGDLYAFEKLGDLKKFYENLSHFRNDDSGVFKLERGVWILVTNVTLGDLLGVPAYLEFMIRKDQEPDPEAHAQKLFFLGMFPPEKFNPKDTRWTKILTHVKDA